MIFLLFFMEYCEPVHQSCDLRVRKAKIECAYMGACNLHMCYNIYVIIDTNNDSII